MKFGIQQTSLGSKAMAESFHLARKVGAAGLGLCYPSTNEVAELGRSKYAESIHELSEAYGIKVTSLHLGCLSAEPTLIGNGPTRPGAMLSIRLAMWVAAEAGVPTVVIPFFGKNRIEFPLEFEYASDALDELSGEAGQLGISLAVESNLNSHQVGLLLESVDNQTVKAALDTAEVAASRLDPATFIRDLGADDIAQVYLRDAVLVRGMPPEFNVRLGRGNVDFNSVMQALHAIGYDGWVNVKAPPGDSNGEIAAANMGFVHDVEQGKRRRVFTPSGADQTLDIGEPTSV